ncbi:STAS domain-containing protein [Streptomyces sp. NPDC013457]|uniref:STAS domain-containing protein n=1 Tax=Streptomyces sp. NPDC013457 TaxID=3364866 RepID=UPI003702C3E9
MVPDLQAGVTRCTPILLHGAPTWQPTVGRASVRLVRTGCPTTAVLHLYGEFDTGTVECLHAAIASVCTTRTRRLLLDLTEVTFADSAFVHALSQAEKRTERLVLIGPLTSSVRRVLDVTGTRKLFHIVLDQAAA